MFLVTDRHVKTVKKLLVKGKIRNVFRLIGPPATSRAAVVSSQPAPTRCTAVRKKGPWLSNKIGNAVLVKVSVNLKKLEKETVCSNASL